MAYLIVWELPLYPETETGKERIVYSGRHSAASMLAYEDARKAIASVYPGRAIASPLESLPKGKILGVYLSPNKKGFGRIAGNFQLWAVEQHESGSSACPRSPCTACIEVSNTLGSPTGRNAEEEGR